MLPLSGRSIAVGEIWAVFRVALIESVVMWRRRVHIGGTARVGIRGDVFSYGKDKRGRKIWPILAPSLPDEQVSLGDVHTRSKISAWAI